MDGLLSAACSRISDRSLDLLIAVFENIIKHPTREKLRVLNCTRPLVATHLVSQPDAMRFLAEAGFVQTGEFLSLSAANVDNPVGILKLARMKLLLLQEKFSRALPSNRKMTPVEEKQHRLLKKAKDCTDQRQLAESRQFLEQALSFGPNSPLYVNALARLIRIIVRSGSRVPEDMYFILKSVDVVLSRKRELRFRFDPHDPNQSDDVEVEIRVSRARALSHLNQQEASLASLTDTMQKFPNNIDTYLHRAMLLGRLRRADDMLRDILIAEKLNTQSGGEYAVQLVRVRASYQIVRQWPKENIVSTISSILGRENVLAASEVERSLDNMIREKSGLEPVKFVLETSRSFATELGDVIRIQNVGLGSTTEDEADLASVLPRICRSRKILDALVHVSLDQSRRCELSPSREGYALRFSDTPKSLGIFLSLSPGTVSIEQLLDTTQELPSIEGGIIIAYHLITECSLCPDTIVRWVIVDGSILHWDRRSLGEILGERTKLSTLLNLFPAIAESAELFSQDSIQHQKKVCRMLHELLLGGLEQFLSREHVVFVPDRILYQVPFACLLDSSGSFLIEKHTVAVSPSLRLMSVHQQQKSEVEHRLSLSGDDSPLPSLSGLVCGFAMHSDEASLPFASREIRAVAATISSASSRPCVVLSQNEFVPQIVELCCTNAVPRYVHIAAHGNATLDALEDNDLIADFKISGRVLCSHNSVLRARTIASSVDFSGTDLVFLSCCSLARGQLQTVGVLGFYRAFHVSGCPSVICALWSVFDYISFSTANQFYDHLLRKGLNKAESLRQAILASMEQPITQSLSVRDVPVAWGAFQLYGHRV